MIDTAFFYAAGLGTRMRPLTTTTPKPLIQVNGLSLLEHALRPARSYGIKNLAVNVHYLAEQIINHPATQDMMIFDEREDLLETGGGLKAALARLGTHPLFTMNTDAVWRGGNPFETLASGWWPKDMSALLLLVRKENAKGYKGLGDFDLINHGQVIRGSTYVYTGCQIIDPTGLVSIPETKFSTNLYWDQLADMKRLFGIVYDGQWCDVGRPESIEIAEQMLRETPNV